MAEFGEHLVENEFESADLKCPACEERLKVIAVTQVSPGTVRPSGSDGFRQQNYSISVKTKILRFEINHVCIPSHEKGATNG